MLNGALAKRYARALFELAGQKDESNQPDVAGIPGVTGYTLDQIDAELKEFTALLADNRELRTVLNHPNIGLSDKKTVVSRVCEGYSQVTLHFLYLLIESRRQELFGLIAREFARMADEARNVTEVRLTSAAALTAEQEKALTEALAARTGGTIRLIRSVDAALIGGARMQIGDTIIDGSVQAALRKMRGDLGKVSVVSEQKAGVK